MSAPEVLSPEVLPPDEDDFLEKIELALDGVLVLLKEPAPNGESDLNQSTERALTPAQTIRIRSQPTYDETWNTVRDIKFVQKQVNETYAPARKKTNLLHKKVKALEDFFLARLADAEKKCKRAIGAYYEQEERRLDDRQAALIAQTAADAPAGEAPQAVVARPTLENMPGGSVSRLYSARVDNLMELVQAVAKGDASIELLEAKQSALNNHAKTLRDTMRVPGVTAVWKPSVRVDAWKAAA